MAHTPPQQTVHTERGRDDGCMERVSLRNPDGQLGRVDGLIDDGAFPNRSEAIRAAVRELTREYRAVATDACRDE